MNKDAETAQMLHSHLTEIPIQLVTSLFGSLRLCAVYLCVFGCCGARGFEKLDASVEVSKDSKTAQILDSHLAENPIQLVASLFGSLRLCAVYLCVFGCCGARGFEELDASVEVSRGNAALFNQVAIVDALFPVPNSLVCLGALRLQVVQHGVAGTDDVLRGHGDSTRWRQDVSRGGGISSRRGRQADGQRLVRIGQSDGSGQLQRRGGCEGDLLQDVGGWWAGRRAGGAGESTADWMCLVGHILTGSGMHGWLAGWLAGVWLAGVWLVSGGGSWPAVDCGSWLGVDCGSWLVMQRVVWRPCGVAWMVTALAVGASCQRWTSERV